MQELNLQDILSKTTDLKEKKQNLAMLRYYPGITNQI